MRGGVSERDVAREVRRAIVEIARGHCSEDALHEELSLSAEGLGLDSVAVAELLVVLSDRLGVPLGEILEQPRGPTVGELIEHARAAVR